MPLKSIFQKTIDLLAHPGAVFYICGWMMVLLVLGTVAQRYVGLFAAQNTFFYSFILWAGPVPLPGGMTTMGLLTLSLALKLIFKSEPNIKRAGAIISHIGAILLMIGGMITYFTAVDGAITLFPQDTSRSFTAYHAREWAAIDDRDSAILARIPFDDIHPGTTLKINGTDITATIITSCRNCTFTTRDPSSIDPDLRGRARDFNIVPIPLAKQDEDNQSAALFKIIGTGTDKDGIHLSADFIAVSPWVDVGGRRIHIAIRKVQYNLPFSVTLNEFRRDMHPGTDMARSYESDITIHEKNTSWPATIRMNEPFRYRGYTFYQSSFIADGKREGSVLAVVKNDGRAYPYIASLIMSLGILIHFIKRITKKPRVMNTAMRSIMLFAAVSFFTLSPAHASDKKDILSSDARRIFADLPIQDQGRIKPIDTFARSTLETFSGRDHTDHDDAVTWLARVLFAPDTTANDAIFRIQNRSVRAALSLPLASGNRYSFNDTVAALSRTRDLWMPLTSKNPDDLSLPQKQILELAQNTEFYMDLARTFMHDRPDFAITNKKLADHLGVTPGTILSSRDIRAHKEKLITAMTALQKKATHMNANKKMTLDETALVDIISRLSAMDQSPKSTLFRVVPPKGDTSLWHTPSLIDPHPVSLLFSSFAVSVHANRPTDTSTIAQSIDLEMASYVPATSFMIEHIFNTWNPMRASLILYILSGILVCVAFTASSPKILWATNRIIPVISSASIVLHLFGVIGRMIILNRPPVTNLYDSILFVGLVGVIGLCAMAIAKRDHLYTLMAVFTGTILQLIALKFDAEGDTLRVLSAVLDTNFWLATHVVVITCGYATSIMTAMLAHAALIHRIIKPTDTARASSLYRTTNTLSFVALFTTTVGTILGGIWADQSWGRFWGWDPKENGALLIVLWLIWVLHGRISGILREVGILGLLAALNIIVALAWFGVNLLGVGLHSYGFTENATWGLTLFCLIETVLIITAVSFIKMKQGRVV